MGLDGISVNQLRITPENTSKENAVNADMLANKGAGSRSVNSLDKKGAIDTDDKENTSFFGGESSNGKEDEEENLEEEGSFEFDKIDLSDKEMYEIKVDENSNSLTIFNKQSNTIIQEISPAKLSSLVDNLKNPGGILINKRI